MCGVGLAYRDALSEQLEQPHGLHETTVHLADARRVQHSGDREVEELFCLFLAEERVDASQVVGATAGDQHREQKVERGLALLLCELPQEKELTRAPLLCAQTRAAHLNCASTRQERRKSATHVGAILLTQLVQLVDELAKSALGRHPRATSFDAIIANNSFWRGNESTLADERAVVLPCEIDHVRREPCLHVSRDLGLGVRVRSDVEPESVARLRLAERRSRNTLHVARQPKRLERRAGEEGNASERHIKRRERVNAVVRPCAEMDRTHRLQHPRLARVVAHLEERLCLLPLQPGL
mmetsp:Transcript_32907/g.76857  ORF Transcript_32907/g.76857 Transcript_32907/m.76857 type:complete len:297 (-) Transcript_32907:1032-1922(-)